MVTFTVDASSYGSYLLVLLLSLCLGFALGMANLFIGFFGELLFGFILAIAGDRSQSSGETFNKGPFIRAFLYFALIIASLVLTSLSYHWAGLLTAVIGGVCLPIAVIKSFTRS